MNNFNETVKSKTNNELLVMVYEFDRWSPEMLLAIENELVNRDILPTDIKDKKQKMIDAEEIELSKGREASLLGQIVGWLTVFGLLGIYIGYNYTFSKVRSKYSDKVFFKYDDNSRKNGSYLFYTSIVLSAIGLLYKFMS
jgi:hypothetical protein